MESISVNLLIQLPTKMHISVFFPPKYPYIAFPCRVNSYSWWEWWLDWVPPSPHLLESFCGCRHEFPCLLFCPFPALSLSFSLCVHLSISSPHLTCTLKALSHRGRFGRLVAAKVKSLYVWTHRVRTEDCSLIEGSSLILLSSLSFRGCLQVSGINTSMSRKREQHVLFMVVIMVICYLLCWLPYGIMALLATFGPPGLVTPEASIIPSVLAKMSTVINPVIYVFMNKQVSGREGGRERCGWGQCLLSFAVTKQQVGGHLHCFHGWYHGDEPLCYIPVRWHHGAFLTRNNLNYVLVCGWWIGRAFSTSEHRFEEKHK